MLRRSLKLSASLLALCSSGTALAQQTAVVANPADSSQSGVFNLGEIEQVTITGSPLAATINESTVSGEEAFKFNALTVDRALDLAAGAASGATGGPRNERLFFVRGFDRFESPLYVDGIRVYLPQDNRLDLGFFPTSNLAEIQIEKGYVSVLDGPGALGGAVNLVTRKPTQPIEYDARGGVTLAGDGQYEGFNTSALVGGATDTQYWQVSGADTKLDQWRLPDSFSGSASQPAGWRLRSGTDDYSTNLKYGWRPNSTDEYSLSYTGDWGKKQATFSVTDPVATQKDWQWPYWNVQSLYFLSNTAIGDTAYVKTKLYYNSFRNGLYSFDNANEDTQTTSKAFDSYYSDSSYGGSIELGNNFGDRDTVKGAFFYRRDTHIQWQKIFAPVFTEPHQTSDEDTYSIAAENRLHVLPNLDFVAGASYDWRDLLQAQSYIDPTAKTPGVFVNFPLANGQSPNGQGALIYNYSDSGHIYADVSDRSRFPTLFERFSTRFGSSLSNPNLKAERAINYEVGGGDTLFGNTHIDVAVYASQVTGLLENVPIIFCDTTSTAPKNCNGPNGVPGTQTAVNQTQNVGNGWYFGYDLSADAVILPDLQAGVRFSYIDRNLDAQNPANPPLPANFHLTGEPFAQGFVYVSWAVTTQLTVTPNLQAASDRWGTSLGGGYAKAGSFVSLNLEADYGVTENLILQAGAKNLLDQNYQLVPGFPSEGRSFFLNLRFRS
jgi:iron complex outermembrane receptor protein